MVKRYDALKAGEEPIDGVESSLWKWFRNKPDRFVSGYRQVVVEALEKLVRFGFGGAIPDDAEVTSAKMQLRPRWKLSINVDGVEKEIPMAGRHDIIASVRSASAGKTVATFHTQRAATAGLTRSTFSNSTTVQPSCLKLILTDAPAHN